MKNTSKIKRFFTKLWYSIPYIMKGGNDEIFGRGIESVDGTEITQNVTDKRVAKHLLKGEVTQEVADLRYRLYLVSEESRKYDYIGNGVALKKQESKIDKNNYKFSMDCKMLCNTVLEALKDTEFEGENKYTLDIAYDNPFIKFKLEKYATYIDVKNENGKIETTLHFCSYPNPYDGTSMPFINALGNIETSENIEAELRKNDFINSIISMSFVTNNATNEFPNMHLFYLENPTFVKIEKTSNEFLITYSWGKFNEENLTDKFYSENMHNKYKNKEKKELLDSVMDVNKEIRCCVCGKEIPLVHRNDVFEDENGNPLCINCFIKKNNLKM